jgi:hypothetical protein
MLLTNIKKKLEKVAYKDREYKVFGSEKHKYKSTKVSLDEIVALENKLVAKLPEEFKVFLLEIGYGAGPYYGIGSLQEIRGEFDSLKSDFKEDFNIEIKPSNPFPFSDIKQVKEGIKFCGIDVSVYNYEGNCLYPTDGSIAICYQGCTAWTVLITGGNLTGNVWDVACYLGFDGMWEPSRRPPGIVGFDRKVKPLDKLKPLPTFLEWYEGWLDRCLLDLDTC